MNYLAIRIQSVRSQLRRDTVDSRDLIRWTTCVTNALTITSNARQRTGAMLRHDRRRRVRGWLCRRRKPETQWAAFRLADAGHRGAGRVLAFTAWLLGRVASAWIGSTLAANKKPASWSGLTNAAARPGSPTSPAPPINKAAPSVSGNTNELVKMSGYALVNSRLHVVLDDGSHYVTGDGHLQYVSARYCVIDGCTTSSNPPEARRQRVRMCSKALTEICKSAFINS
jgi:hypothetical protein